MKTTCPGAEKVMKPLDFGVQLFDVFYKLQKISVQKRDLYLLSVLWMDSYKGGTLHW